VVLPTRTSGSLKRVFLNNTSEVQHPPAEFLVIFWRVYTQVITD